MGINIVSMMHFQHFNSFILLLLWQMFILKNVDVYIF